MRGLRWLILVAIVGLAAFVARTYQERTDSQTHEAPKPAVALPEGVNIQSEEWRFTQSEKGREKARMRAKNFRQLKDSEKVELEGVTLEIPHKDGKQYDRIKTEKAEFDQKAETLYADGEVEIFMDVPEGAEPTGRLIKIVTSGVWFERSGKAHTQRDVSFEFDRGSGKSTGALYDTSTRALHLNKNVELIWKGASKDTIPMRIECDNAVYRETESEVYLLPWSKLHRGGLDMDAGATVVKLKEGRIDVVEAQKAKGVQDDPGKRKLEFGAEFLVMTMTPEGQVTKITGDNKARLDSVTKTSRTAVTSDKVVMDFEPGKKESALTKAFAGGKAVLVSTPLQNAAGETRVIKSEVVELFMRAGGEEIDRAETAAPSSLELIPNRATQPHRWLNGERFLVRYGKENQIDHFETTAAKTRTKPAAKPGAKKPEPLILTSSRKLDAEFDPKSGQLAKLHQSEDFQYEAGDRKARSVKADMDQATELILLTGSARVWDPTGSTTGDTVQLNQKTGEFIAEGNVTSTRLPDKKPGKATTAMMSHEDPTQATARKMTSLNNNRLIRYEGNAVTWQGSNRVTADRIEIDRENEVLRANGNVVSQFADRAEDKKEKKDDKKKKASPKPAAQTAPVFTIVKAPELIYTEADRLAHYREGAVLNRPGLNVKGQQLRAYLNDSSEESSLSRVTVDGNVEIVQTAVTPQRRTRTGTSDHADYYPDEEKIVLLGGTPLLIDSIKGRTTGRELIYFSQNEKLIVDGVEQKPTESVIKRKTAK